MTLAASWDWWLKSDAGLVARVAIGAAIFAALAFIDWRRNRERATRWREYTFLLACVLIALAYGAIHDQITTTISWEYFAYGKGVAEHLPPNEPPNSPAFRWEAAKIGMKATWTAGLIVGVALMLANNPRRDGRARLTYRCLLAFLPLVIGLAILTSICLGIAGYFGAFVPMHEDFRVMLERNEMHPRRFMAVYGVHLGGYIGGTTGMIVAVLLVRRARRRGAPL